MATVSRHRHPVPPDEARSSRMGRARGTGRRSGLGWPGTHRRRRDVSPTARPLGRTCVPRAATGVRARLPGPEAACLGDRHWARAGRASTRSPPAGTTPPRAGQVGSRPGGGMQRTAPRRRLQGPGRRHSGQIGSSSASASGTPGAGRLLGLGPAYAMNRSRWRDQCPGLGGRRPERPSRGPSALTAGRSFGHPGPSQATDPARRSAWSALLAHSCGDRGRTCCGTRPGGIGASGRDPARSPTCQGVVRTRHQLRRGSRYEPVRSYASRISSAVFTRPGEGTHAG